MAYTGVYRCQIVGRIVTEHLAGGIVDRELGQFAFSRAKT